MDKNKEPTDKEIEDFWRKKKEEDEKRRVANNKCEEIKNNIANSSLKLDSTTPLWHTERASIDFDKQKDTLNIYDNGFVVIDSVEIELLFEHFQEFYPDVETFRDNILFSDGFTDSKICNVIANWVKGNRLIPPTFSWNEKSDKICAIDGKHRLKVAYTIGTKLIPIIVPNSDAKEIKRLLGIP